MGAHQRVKLRHRSKAGLDGRFGIAGDFDERAEERTAAAKHP
jgi:hypothetical protein